jgi:hypothetical protein
MYADGDMTCPKGFPKKQLLTTAAQDTRDCSACTCDASGVTCTILSAELDIDPMCAMKLDTVVANGMCHSAAAGVSNGLSVTVQVGGACTSTGNSAIGAVANGPLTTFCCVH